MPGGGIILDPFGQVGFLVGRGGAIAMGPGPYHAVGLRAVLGHDDTRSSDVAELRPRDASCH